LRKKKERVKIQTREGKNGKRANLQPLAFWGTRIKRGYSSSRKARGVGKYASLREGVRQKPPWAFLAGLHRLERASKTRRTKEGELRREVKGNFGKSFIVSIIFRKEKTTLGKRGTPGQTKRTHKRNPERNSRFSKTIGMGGCKSPSTQEKSRPIIRSQKKAFRDDSSSSVKHFFHDRGR